jgi:hypothetical protein
VAGCDPDPDAARYRDHRRLRTSRTRPNASASTFSSTLRRLPSAPATSNAGGSIWATSAARHRSTNRVLLFPLSSHGGNDLASATSWFCALESAVCQSGATTRRSRGSRIKSLTVGTAESDVKASRKRRLLKGPEEFRDVRVDRSTAKRK